ncbi:MAG: FCD domain-containing protein [Azovibrio sp.]|nr:FCD domain-containing protein [Azovibrio sp.]
MNSHASAIAFLQTCSLPSLIQQQLEKMILDGELPPGSQLTEIPLAARLGVSRGPVREAFRGLEEKGLVRMEKNRGVFVRTITPSEADAIYEVRLALEALIVKKLAAIPDKVQAARLDELLDEADKFAHEADFAACHERNIAFHDRLVCLTGNAALIDSYRRLVGELSLFRHQAHAQIADASSLRASVADHRAILAALSSGQRATAARLLHRHVEASRKRLQRLLKTQSPPSP